jgi:hypothetical protein
VAAETSGLIIGWLLLWVLVRAFISDQGQVSFSKTYFSRGRPHLRFGEGLDSDSKSKITPQGGKTRNGKRIQTGQGQGRRTAGLQVGGKGLHL